MMNPAEKLEYQAPSLMYGQVLESQEPGYRVLTTFGPLDALKAVGCLVEPEPEDTVLLSVDPEGLCFILSVLLRHPGGGPKTRIRFEGPVDIQVNGGDLALSSETDLRLASGRSLEMTSGQFNLHAEEGRIVVDSTSVLGRNLKAEFKTIRTVARTVEHWFHSFTQKFKNTWRYVSDHEEIQARSTRRLNEESLTVQAGNEYHLVEDTVKIDAGQIHLG